LSRTNASLTFSVSGLQHIREEQKAKSANAGAWSWLLVLSHAFGG
jgi:hypothetical protein